MIYAPDISPIAIAIGPLKIHWYGLMYLAAFATAWWIGLVRARRENSGWNSEQVADLVTYGAFGVILGGRIGYVLFYNPAHYLAAPLKIFAVWDGGMSFHGGFLGVIVAYLLYARASKRHWLDVADFAVPMIPFGIAAVRFGNFINHELWGRVTTVPWGMIFRDAGNLPRHPSQLYEAALEGLLMFMIIWWFVAKPRPRAAPAALFVLLYGLFRIFAEFFREPDAHLSFIAFDWVTMGMVLSLPMVIVGLGVLRWAYRSQKQGA